MPLQLGLNNLNYKDLFVYLLCTQLSPPYGSTPLHHKTDTGSQLPPSTCPYHLQPQQMCPVHELLL